MGADCDTYAFTIDLMARVANRIRATLPHVIEWPRA